MKHLDPSILTTLVKSKCLEVLLGKLDAYISKCTLKPLWSQNMVHFTFFLSQCTWIRVIKNTVVQSIELQGNGFGTGKSCQISRGTGITIFAGAAPLMTDNKGVAAVKGVPQLK